MSSIKYILALLLFTYCGFSQTLTVKDTNVLIGKEYNIPVTYSGTISPEDVYSIHFTFPAAILDIKDIICTDSLISYKQVITPNSQIGTLDVEIKKKNLSTHDTLFFIKALCLAGKQNPSLFTPEIFKLNGQVSTVSFESGVIYPLEGTIRQNDLRIEYAKPNPIPNYGEIPFTLSSDAAVKIYAYSISGKLVISLPEYSYINYRLLDYTRTEVKDFNLKKGTYYLELTPNQYDNSGAFFLVLEANGETKSINFMIEK